MRYKLPDKCFGYHSLITCHSSMVTGMNNGFLNQTGYSESEIINRHVDDVLTGMLRIPQKQLRQLRKKGVVDCYLFTKSLHPRNVYIKLVEGHDADHCIYCFKEKSISSLDDNLILLGQLTHNNDAGYALYALPDLILLKASQKYLSFLPEPSNREEYSIGKPVSHIIPGFKGSMNESVWNFAMGTGKIQCISEYRREFGELVTYWDSRIIPVFKNGKVKYIFEIIMDATERVINRQLIKDQADNLEKARQLKAEILESISDGFISLDEEWRFTYVNRHAASYLGCEPKALLGQVIWDCFKHMRRTEIAGHFREVMQERKPVNFEYFCTENHRYYNCSVYPSAVGISVYWVDITKHKHAEKEAIRNKRRADILYEIAEKLHASHNPQSIIKELCLKILPFLDCQVFVNYLVDEKKKKLRLNACWGLDEKEQEAIEWLDFGISVCGCAARDRTRVVAEHIQHSNDIRTEWIKSIGVRAYACHPLIENGRVVGTLAFGGRNKDTFSPDDLALMKAVSDLMAIAINRVRTERIMKEQHQLMLESERERNAALKKAIELKDEFLSIISHEFKTPLAVIFSAIETMEHTCGSQLPEKAKGFIHKIRQNSFRQLRLVNNLLDIARINSGWVRHNWRNIDIVPITKSITDSVECYARQKGITIQFSSTVKQRVIRTDEEKYERILLNLLSNAIKFTSGGKTIMVRVSMKNRLGRRMVCIEVKDEGVGIPDEKMDLIFDRFVQVDSSLTRQAEGAGIGLYLAKMLTESLGGAISVKSKVGRGSSFFVFFPDLGKNESHKTTTLSKKDGSRLAQTARVEFSDVCT